jgi:hypothetical protein
VVATVDRQRGELEDAPVQLAVEPVDRRDVAMPGRLRDLEVDGAQHGQLVVAGPANGTDQLGFEKLEQIVNLLEVPGAQPGDEVALMRPVREQAFGGEHAQRFPQRHPADAEEARHLLLADLLSGEQIPVDDHRAQLIDHARDASAGRRAVRHQPLLFAVGHVSEYSSGTVLCTSHGSW